jgi:hypothetical protein
MKRHIFTLLVTLVLCSTVLSASPIVVGTFDIAGTVTVTEDQISWTLFVDPNTFSEKTLIQQATGIYDGLIEGTLATIQDLDRSDSPVDPNGPPEVTFGPFTFISFDAQPSLTILDINHIFEGVEGFTECLLLPAAPGQHCTPSGPQFGGPSPFSFTNKQGGGSTASFTFEGVGDGGLTWIGEFSAQFNTPFQTVLSAFDSNNPNASHSVTNSYSATITVSQQQVPEPATMSMIGIALLAVPLGIKRFRKRQGLNR